MSIEVEVLHPTHPGLLMPLRTSRGMNAREHPMARHRRVRKEREAVAWWLTEYRRHHGKPRVPCSVLLTRLSPGVGLDDDNLVSALKGVRDEIARWLGVDDRDRLTVRYRYAQRRGPWGVLVEFGAPVAGAQLVLEAIE